MNIGTPDFGFAFRFSQVFEGVDMTKAFGDRGQQILERLDYLQRQLENNVVRPEVTGSYAGALTASTGTPWHVRKGAVLKEFRCLLGTAGSSNTVLDVKKNGVSVGTVTLASSATSGSVAVDVPFIGDSDVLTFTITTVGTGAKDLTAIARFI